MGMRIRDGNWLTKKKKRDSNKKVEGSFSCTFSLYFIDYVIYVQYMGIYIHMYIYVYVYVWVYIINEYERDGEEEHGCGG